MADQKVLLKVENLKKYFPLKKRSVFQKDRLFIKANDGISIDIYEGETLGLVGESGCGKSTFGRTILQLYDQTEGNTLYYGRSLADLAPKYVDDVLGDVSKNFPRYLKELADLEQLKNQVEIASDEIEKGKLLENVEHKHAQIDNEYQNMLRIVGGLLVHKDLNEVAQLLKVLFKHQREVASLNRKIEALENNRREHELDNNQAALAKLDQQLQSLQQQKDQAHNMVELAQEPVLKLREQNASHDQFDVYEAQLDDGIDLAKLTKAEMRLLRRDLQIIFQDPYSSLNPRLTVGQIIGEGLQAHGIFKNTRSKEYNEYIIEVMDKCGLAPYFIHRYPHQFSGGQRQRIGIARALALNPRFIVADEAVSALDVSIQSQIINLLIDLKRDMGLTYLFITHDLSVVKFISDRIGVMYLGNLVELASSDAMFEKPLHPYTQALLEAIPRTDVDANQELSILEGDIPSPINPPKGCKFHTRCKYAFDKCYVVEPIWQEYEPGHFVACHLYEAE